MRKTLLAMMVMGLMVALMATPAFAFHHTTLPVVDCADANAGSPSNNNGEAKESLIATGQLTLPLAPFGTAGSTASSATPAEDNCPPVVTPN